MGEQTQQESATTFDNKNKKSKSWLFWCIACIACFAGGYYMGSTPSDKRTKIAEVIQGFELNDSNMLSHMDSIATIDTVKPTKASDSSIQTPPVDKKPLTAKKAESPKPATSEKAAMQKPATAGEACKPANYMKYEQMDARVRTGAYYIMGTQEIIKARKDETVEHLSRRILGNGMACYIEVYNGLHGSDVLKEGQEVKIPKLELKKIVKKRNQNN